MPGLFPGCGGHTVVGHRLWAVVDGTESTGEVKEHDLAVLLRVRERSMEEEDDAFIH